MIQFCFSNKNTPLQKGIHEVTDKNGYFLVYSEEEIMSHCPCHSKIHILEIKKEDILSRISPSKIRVRKMRVLKTLPLWSLQTVEQLHLMNVNLRAGDDIFTVCAVRNGFLDIVQFMVEKVGVPVNASCLGLLKWAAFGGSEPMARYLLQNGADPNNGSMAALKEAVKRKDAQMTALLLSYGAKTRETKNDESLLCLAIEQEDYEVIRLILDAEAGNCKKYHNAFERAIEMEQMPTLRLLCEDTRINIAPFRRNVQEAMEQVTDEEVRVYLDDYFAKNSKDEISNIQRLARAMKPNVLYTVSDLLPLLDIKSLNTVRYSFLNPATEANVIEKIKGENGKIYHRLKKCSQKREDL